MASGGDGDGDGVSPRLYPGLVLSPLYMLPHLILTTGEKQAWWWGKWGGLVGGGQAACPVYSRSAAT